MTIVRSVLTGLAFDVLYLIAGYFYVWYRTPANSVIGRGGLYAVATQPLSITLAVVMFVAGAVLGARFLG